MSLMKYRCADISATHSECRFPIILVSKRSNGAIVYVICPVPHIKQGNLCKSLPSGNNHVERTCDSQSARHRTLPKALRPSKLGKIWQSHDRTHPGREKSLDNRNSITYNLTRGTVIWFRKLLERM